MTEAERPLRVRCCAPPSGTPRGLFPDSLMSAGAKTGEGATPSCPVAPVPVLCLFGHEPEAVTVMTSEEIHQEKARIVERYGDWINHNIHLGSDFFTMGKDVRTGAEVKLTRILQMVGDVAGGSLEPLRVLDLACLEGLYGLEFALHGAEVVGIEGREPNIEKARFAQSSLGLENMRLFHGDVRQISAARYGTFDVVLCLGIFYHLDKCDIPAFLSRLA